MSIRGEVLVVILNNRADMALARNQHWYRIPIEQAEKLKHRNCWNPKWLAFYQTKVFDDEAYTVTYYADVIAIQEVDRWELFPDEPKDSKSQQRYCKLELTPLKQLAKPIASNQLRRITFIPTTWEKFIQAREINDL